MPTGRGILGSKKTRGHERPGDPTGRREWEKGKIYPLDPPPPPFETYCRYRRLSSNHRVVRGYSRRVRKPPVCAARLEHSSPSQQQIAWNPALQRLTTLACYSIFPLLNLPFLVSLNTDTLPRRSFHLPWVFNFSPAHRLVAPTRTAVSCNSAIHSLLIPYSILWTILACLALSLATASLKGFNARAGPCAGSKHPLFLPPLELCPIISASRSLPELKVVQAHPSPARSSV